jgi:hypothetical protein
LYRWAIRQSCPEDSDFAFIPGCTICLSSIGADLYSLIDIVLQNDFSPDGGHSALRRDLPFSFGLTEDIFPQLSGRWISSLTQGGMANLAHEVCLLAYETFEDIYGCYERLRWEPMNLDIL